VSLVQRYFSLPTIGVGQEAESYGREKPGPLKSFHILSNSFPMMLSVYNAHWIRRSYFDNLKWRNTDILFGVLPELGIKVTVLRD
jgi:hypothetical protein